MSTLDPDPEIDQLRPVPVDPRDERCFNLMRSWLEECAGHESCPKRGQVALPKRVVEISSEPDVAPRIRTTNGETGEYVTLSHCWGECLTTRQEAWDIANSPDGFKIEQLPKNFGDAVTIARRLGFHYLWADALCVAPEEWAAASSNAISIYGQAAVMIAATESSNCDAGIFQDRNVHFSPGFGPSKDRFFRLRLLRWDEDIERSPLECRGWAAQERMLAPRIIHFTKRQLIWECASAGPRCLYFEASGISDTVGSGQIDMHYWKSCFQPLVTLALQKLRHVQPASNAAEDTSAVSKNTINRIKRWHQCVDEFSWRQLTDPMDKLPAVANLAAVVDDGTLGDYLAGIWSKHFVAGLTWGRQYLLLRRAPVYRAPSWSWASLDGKVSSTVLAGPTTGIEELDQDEKWTERYGLRLLETHMIPRDPNNPYMGVLEGSHVIVEGACIDFKQYADLVSRTASFFAVTGLDTADTFDCPHCRPKADEDGAKTSETMDHKDHLPFDLVTVTMGSGWKEAESRVQLLLLRWTNEEQVGLERVGTALLQRHFFNDTSADVLDKAFDGAGWERKVMKLV